LTSNGASFWDSSRNVCMIVGAKWPMRSRFAVLR
jgi:hypothetical protein